MDDELYCPPPRIRFSANLVTNGLYCIFGGINAKQERSLRSSVAKQKKSFFNDIYFLQLDAASKKWSWSEPQKCFGDIPTARYGHSCTVVTFTSMENEGVQGKERRSLVIFGGNSLKGLLNDIVVLDLDTFEWKNVNVEGEAPPKSYYHTANLIGTNKIFIFGGRSSEGESNDAYLLEISSNLKEWKWTKLNLEGRAPSKRYQHQAFSFGSNSLLIYGGIKRMSVMQDLTLCDLETMEWKDLPITNNEANPTRAREMSCLIQHKRLVVLDFDEMLNTSSTMYLEIDDNATQADWKSAAVTGDLLENSQFYALVNMDFSNVLLLDLTSTDRNLTVLAASQSQFEEGNALEFTTLRKPSRSRKLQDEISVISNMITFDVHYASSTSRSFSVSMLSPISSLITIIREQYNVRSPVLFLWNSDLMMYQEISTDAKYQAILEGRQSTRSEKVYIAEEMANEEDKFDFLTSQISEFAQPQLEQDSLLHSPDFQSRQQVAKRAKKRSATTVVNQPLPVLFTKPAHTSFVRKLHKWLKRFEKRGLTTDVKQLKEQKIEGTVADYASSYLQWLFLCVCGFYYFFKSRTVGKVALCLIMALNFIVFSLPVLSAALVPREEEDKDNIVGILTPVLLYIMFCFAATSTEWSWQDRKRATRELARYPVTVYQHLVTNEYGKRSTTAEDIIYAITNKEETTTDKKRNLFAVYAAPIIAAAVHTFITVGYLQGKTVQGKHWVITYSLVVNAISTFLYAFVLGLALNVYARQLHHIQYFGILFHEKQAKASGLPTLPLRSVKNIIAWMKIRGYIQSHQFLPLTSANAFFRWSLTFLAFLWVAFVVIALQAKTLTPVTAFLLFHIVLTCLYMFWAIIIGLKINSWQQKHIVMLYKEQMKLALEIQHLESEVALAKTKKKIEKLAHCKHLIHEVIEVVEKQDPVFQFMGLQFSEGATKMITYLLGFMLSITVIFTARAEVDLELE